MEALRLAGCARSIRVRTGSFDKALSTLPAHPDFANR
jgi:hypothetical protein